MIVEDQSEVVAFLQETAGLGGAAVERIETHISIVFLAGDLAYKLKRAVRYDYLDFATAEKRAAACEAELRLNRRTAPALYLETRAIRRDRAGRLGFGGEGPLIDIVVIMRRFDQESLFDRLATKGALTPALMRDLADRIADFHRRAEMDREAGGEAGLAAIIEGNARNLDLAAPAILDAGEVARVTAGSRAALAEVSALVEERRRHGKVRLCHGDLHLRNICLLESVPTLFDCVEFSRAIATVDVLYDLSFLLMDLAHRRLPNLANAVFNRYFDIEAEVEGAATLPLFLSMHAAIRAHVTAAALMMAPPATGAAAMDPRAEEARGYLALAGRLLDRPPPRLIAIGGLSGTGKSTLAYGLAPGIGGVPGARVLRSDVLRKRLMGVAPEERLPGAGYARSVTDQVYSSLGDEAGRLLQAGRSVILDAVFLRPEERRAVAGLAVQLGVAFQGLWLEAPADLLSARIQGRRKDASDATVEILRRQLAQPAGPMDWSRLAAGGDRVAVLAAAEEMIR